jgi:hypothetical protein
MRARAAGQHDQVRGRADREEGTFAFRGRAMTDASAALAESRRGTTRQWRMRGLDSGDRKQLSGLAFIGQACSTAPADPSCRSPPGCCVTHRPGLDLGRVIDFRSAGERRPRSLRSRDSRRSERADSQLRPSRRGPATGTDNGSRRSAPSRRPPYRRTCGGSRSPSVHRCRTRRTRWDYAQQRRMIGHVGLHQQASGTRADDEGRMPGRMADRRDRGDPLGDLLVPLVFRHFARYQAHDAAHVLEIVREQTRGRADRGRPPPCWLAAGRRSWAHSAVTSVD